MEMMMVNDPMPNFEIPTEMRQVAEKSLEEAKKSVRRLYRRRPESRRGGRGASYASPGGSQGCRQEGNGVRRTERRDLV